MLRKTLDLATETFDILVIGGGITGACIARDAARRRLRVALVEKGDFSSGTSAATSKLVHGGLRYLQQRELGLVRESLRERALWLQHAPHLVRPLPFLLPVHSRRQQMWLGLGLSVYDRFAGSDAATPPHAYLSRDEAVAAEPALAAGRCIGALAYHDGQMLAPERLALECLIDAYTHGAVIANYVRATAAELRGDRIQHVSVSDQMTGDRFDIKARYVINAAGPWADDVTALLTGVQRPPRLTRSKGIHVVVPAITTRYALTLPAHGTHFFVIPWRQHSLVATTDTPYTGATDAVGVDWRDIRPFLAAVRDALPGAALDDACVRYAYAGLRPLVTRSGDTYRASRRGELEEHRRSGGPANLLSALGGKWTTSRATAEAAVDIVAMALGATDRRCVTRDTPLPGGQESPEAVRAFLSTADVVLDAECREHLAQQYGALVPRVILAAADAPGRIAPGHHDIYAQILVAVRHEMAMTLDDIVFRRTGLGTLGPLRDDVLATLGAFAGALLGWSADERELHLATVRRRWDWSVSA